MDITIYIGGPSIFDKLRNKLGREANCFRCGYGDAGHELAGCDIYPFNILDDAKQAVKETSETFPDIKPFIYSGICIQIGKVPFEEMKKFDKKYRSIFDRIISEKQAKGLYEGAEIELPSLIESLKVSSNSVPLPKVKKCPQFHKS